jgi:hypothetical protein
MAASIRLSEATCFMMQPLKANLPTYLSGTRSCAGSIEGFDDDHRKRCAQAIRMQRSAILVHCAEMTRRLGRPVSLDEAARDWIPVNAEIWRSRFEKQFVSRATSMQPRLAKPGRS